MANIHIEKIIDTIDHLSPISPVGVQMIDAVQQPEVSMEKISNIVCQDLAIASNLLKSVNSAYYALPRKIDSVHEAVTYLGINKIYELVVLHALSNNIKSDCSAYALDAVDLWQHSVGSAFVSRAIGGMLGFNPNRLNTLFTAALIKDIGKVVLQQFLPEKTDEMSKLIQDQNLSFDKAEQAAFGISHPEIGARIAEKWHLPQTIVDVIRHHHNSGDISDKTILIVQNGDYIVSMMGIGCGLDGFIYNMSPAAGELLSDQQLQQAMINFMQQKSELFSMINKI